jgi:hypothetical protein
MKGYMEHRFSEQIFFFQKLTFDKIQTIWQDNMSVYMIITYSNWLCQTIGEKYEDFIKYF